MKKWLLLILFILLIIPTAFSVPEGISFNIRYFDKKIYFPDDEILLKIMISNNSGDSYKFKIAENRVFNLDFDVRTLTNRTLKHAQKFTRERNSNQAVFYREISLEPGEEYAFTEDLNEYIQIGEGAFVVTAHFYPELYSNQKDHFVSNRLSLSVRPSMSKAMEEEFLIAEETQEALRRESLAPDEVVEYTIRARQKEQWEKFFLYIDAESLLKKNDRRRERYIRLSEEERLEMLEEFESRLMQETTDRDIVLIPSEFEILKTTYTPIEGSVIVRMKFDYADFSEIKEYTYFLSIRDNIWYITDYEVRNLGTE